MTEQSDPQRQQTEEGQDRTATKRPRGIGGVLLIIGLMLALFIMISRSGMEQEKSLYDLYRHLFRGEVQKTHRADGRLIAEVRARNEKKTERISIVMDKVLEDDQRLIDELQARQIDLETYSAANGGIEKFLKDTTGDTPSALATRAFWISDLPGKSKSTRANTSESTTPSTPSYSMSAIIVRGGTSEWVAIEPTGRANAKSLLDLRSTLAAGGVDITERTLSLDSKSRVVEKPNTALFYFLGTIGPYILVFIIIWFFIIRQMRSPGGSGGVLSFGRSRAALYTKENRTNITFDDVAGIEEAKGELREIIEFLKNPGKFAKLGGNIPRGVLLVGSPGTGKTLMAKAIAGEAEVPFFSISGSDFVEMFVGVGASRVRDLFKQARENSPCIVFLDEIDAVGRKRGSGMGGGHDEREQTLNAILVEMDGFDSDKGTILIAATNRPDVLDPALLRPGRFDRQITIDMPDVNGREQILRVHARKVKMRPDVDLAHIARATSGFSGADLAALINEGAILAAMRNVDFVELSDLEEARDRVRWGREKRSRAMEEEDLRVTAYHEAGHALVSTMIPGLDPVHKVTIVSRGMALGATMSLPERDDYHQRRDKLLGLIAMCYGGRIAEDIVFGDISAGAQNDIEKATQIAKTMVCELGMSDAVGPINYTNKQGSEFLGSEFAIASDISDETLELINKEIRRMCDEQYQRATKILQDNRTTLDKIAEGLLEYETLNGDEVGAIIRGDNLADYRAARQRSQPPAVGTDSADTADETGEEPDVGLSGAEGLAHP